MSKSKNGRGKGKRIIRQKALPTPVFARKVKIVMAKQVEKKTCTYNSNVTAFNQQINSTGDCLRLMPIITQGTAENQRIGNEIKLKSLNIRGVLTFTLGQTTAANTRIGVRVLILKAKRYMDWNASASDFGTNYTKLLEGSTTGFQGSLADFNTPINRDYFTVVSDKRFYMSQSTQQSGIATPGQPQVSQTTKFINMKIPYSRRNIQYDQDFNNGEPLNYPYMMVVGYSKLGGEVADGAGASYLTLQYNTTATYTDQ